jgi:hypothetical protein
MKAIIFIIFTLFTGFSYSQPFKNNYIKTGHSKNKSHQPTAYSDKFKNLIVTKNGFRVFKLGSDIRKYFNSFSFENSTEKRSVVRVYSLASAEFNNADLRTLHGVLINSIVFFCYNDYKIGAIVIQTGVNDSNANIINSFRKDFGKETKEVKNNTITYLWSGNSNNIFCSKPKDIHGDAYIESISIYQKKYVSYRDSHTPNDGL